MFILFTFYQHRTSAKNHARNKRQEIVIQNSVFFYFYYTYLLILFSCFVGSLRFCHCWNSQWNSQWNSWREPQQIRTRNISEKLKGKIRQYVSYYHGNIYVQWLTLFLRTLPLIQAQQKWHHGHIRYNKRLATEFTRKQGSWTIQFTNEVLL